MEYSTVYVGMDVHKDTFSVCCYTYEDDKCKFKRSFSSCRVESSPTLSLKNIVCIGETCMLTGW